VILDIHDMTSDLFSAKFGAGGPAGRLLGRVVRAVETAAYRFATAILTVHAPYRERIEPRVPGTSVQDVLNVPDAEGWPAIADERLARPPADGVLTIGHHGTIAHRFGADVAVAAVASLRAEGVASRIRILGDGDFAPEVKAAVDALGPDAAEFGRRTFLVEEVPAFAETIDIGVAPYRRSPFVDQLLPVKVLEYLALGVPVVATSTAVMRHYLDASAVRYVDDATVEAVTEALRELSDPTVRLAYATAGRDAMRKLGWEAQRRRLLDWVATVAGPPVRH
jgi:glycosyltransferase involved in cell wall biosynthesis